MHAADLQVLAGGAKADALSALAGHYEQACGQRIVYRFGTTPVLIGLATSADPFDLGVVPVDVMKDAAARARFAAGPTTDIARVGLGVAVRSGTRKPEIGNAEALKQALLGAQSVATIPASAGGTQVLRVLEALGISEAMKARLKAQSTPAQLVQAVANGEVDLGIFLLNVLTAPGLEVVGPVPAELHQEVVFTAAVAGNTNAAEAARAFIAYLATPAATAVLKAKGLRPA